MKELIEIYELKLKNVNARLDEFKGNDSWNDIRTKERLTTKKFEYMAFLDDLRRVCPKEEEKPKPIYMTNNIEYCLFKRVQDTKNHYYVRIKGNWNDLPLWSMGHINNHGTVSLVGGDLLSVYSEQLEAEYTVYLNNL